MTIHMARPGTIRTDEHGAVADVVCGAVGSYYSTNPNEVTCERCAYLRSERLARAALVLR